jgi:L-rhamnose-H+ transport protein
MFRIGLVFSIFVCIGAALLNIAFTNAAPVAKAATDLGALPRNASLVSWIVVLWGGFVSNIVYAIFLLSKNQSLSTLTQKGASKGILWALFTALF